MSVDRGNQGRSPPPRRWNVGNVTITKIVESQDFFDVTNMFSKATVDAVLALPWLQPHFLTPEGRGIVSIHALVVDTPTKRIMVDTCVGNDKNRLPWEFFTNLQTDFLRDLESSEFARETFDVVLCTHLHVDHVGWNTMLVDDRWVPTFPNARYLLSKVEYDYWSRPTDVPDVGGWDEVQRKTMVDSVEPVLAAGLVDLVEGTYRVCEEVTLVPTLGHSPGHISVRIVSRGEEALITGDMSHHPCQLAHPDWGLSIDFDADMATNTRRRVFADSADRSVLVIGTHWAGASAGKIERSGDVFLLKC